MTVRLKALLLSLLVGACTAESVEAPPPVVRASGPAMAGPSVPAAGWRVVLIAGDNNTQAFDNGVDALRAKLARRGVRDIRVFTSDPAANPGKPVATAANVSGALRTPGGEACLAFITSHGDESGFVLRQARGTVAPSSLDAALDAGCGTRPTVVVVSACHSGVFLSPAMRQPNRIVLSAAAADRVSFGCGAGDQYTYFDQCLLQQFDGATTWQQLAGTTRDCVLKLERDMGIRRSSMPQSFFGSAVAGLRIPGR
ncbi:C13 family peptidase [Reyranella sp.]|uniref:C13 family peptidase n=1 Tax=Reyranella sp. TaxID=1929291 RepID=UPI003BAD08A7